jgi:hypothetical protein
MKVTGTLRDEKNGKEIFHVYFDDGITINIKRIKDKFEYDSMIATGLGNYFLKKGKWPKGKNLEKRIDLGVALITKNLNNNRYKIKKQSK